MGLQVFILNVSNLHMWYISSVHANDYIVKCFIEHRYEEAIADLWRTAEAVVLLWVSGRDMEIIAVLRRWGWCEWGVVPDLTRKSRKGRDVVIIWLIAIQEDEGRSTSNLSWIFLHLRGRKEASPKGIQSQMVLFSPHPKFRGWERGQGQGLSEDQKQVK